MSSFMSEKESIALEKFREIVTDLDLTHEQRDDLFLIKWLRAQNLDVNKAYEMLRKSLVWRKEQDLDDILNWKPPKNFYKEFPYEICGNDLSGCPILFKPFGKWDVRKAIEAGQSEEWLKYFDLELAIVQLQMKENTKRLGYPITQFIMIVDLENFAMRQISSMTNVNTMLDLVRRFDANYPEILKGSYIINASRVFTILFTFVKPLLSNETLSKVHIFGSNHEEWKKVLLQNIPSDQLPIKYGGTMKLKEEPIIQSNTIIEEFKAMQIRYGKCYMVELDVVQTL